MTEKGSIQDGGNVVIYKVESKKSLFRQAAEKVDFGAHFTPFWEGFWMTFRSLFGHLGTKAQKSGFLGHCKNDGFLRETKASNHN